MSNRPVPPPDPDMVAFVTVRLHWDGQVSIQGTLGDPAMTMQLLDCARDAIGKRLPAGGIVVPGREVDVEPAIPVREFGSMEPHERGDG